jgi:hypothetical protein
MSKGQNANKKTLDTQHVNKLQEFSNNDTNISKLQKEIEGLQNKIKKFKPRSELNDSEFDNYISLTDQLSLLRKKMDKLESLDDEIDYYMNTAPILFQYYDILENGKNVNTIRKPVASEKSILKYFMQPSSGGAGKSENNGGGSAGGGGAAGGMGSSVGSGGSGAGGGAGGAAAVSGDNEVTMDRASLLEKYMNVTDSNYIKPMQDEPKDRCIHCKSNDRNIMLNDGLIYCNNCHTVEYIIIDHERPSYKDPPKEMESPKAFRILKQILKQKFKKNFNFSNAIFRFLKVLFKTQC